MSDRWYYQLLMEEFGPVSKEYVLELLCEGTLGENELVRKERGGDWITISEMKETRQTLASSTNSLEEIQDLSELNFEFETSSSVASRSSALNPPLQSPRLIPPAFGKPSTTTRDSAATAHAEAPVRKRAAAPVKAGKVTPESRQQKPPVANGKQKRVSPARETPKTGRSKRISSNGIGIDDELPDDVFNDVFHKQDTTSQRSLSAPGSMATASSMSPIDGYSVAANASPTPVSAVYSASPVMKAIPARMAYSPPMKRSVSVSEPMDFKKIGTVSGAVTAIAGVLAVSFFGWPFSGSPPQAPFDPQSTVVVLNTIMKNFEAVGESTDESACEECLYTVRPQVNAILAITKDAGPDAPKAVACREAAEALMKIADALPENPEIVEAGRIEFEKLIAMVK